MESSRSVYGVHAVLRTSMISSLEHNEQKVESSAGRGEHLWDLTGGRPQSPLFLKCFFCSFCSGYLGVPENGGCLYGNFFMGT